MNKSNDVLIGVLSSFDTISHSGEIEIVDSGEVVYISKKYNLINPIFFELVGELEFQFTYIEFANKNYFKTHLINNLNQKDLKKAILTNFIARKQSNSVTIQELVEQIGLARDGTRALFEELQQEKVLNYRIVGQGEIIVDLLSSKRKSLEKKVKNFSIEELYMLSEKLPDLQRIEFQKSMDIDNIRLKFLNASWEEIIDIINLRLGVNRERYSEDLKDFNLNNQNVKGFNSQSSDDIERDENLLNFGIAETNAERDFRLKKQRKEREAKEKAIENEKKKNQSETGYLETNLERTKREQKEKILKERKIAEELQEKKLLEERKVNFDETGIYESNNERIHRENLSESIEVDVDLLNKRRKYGDKKRQFVKNLNVGDALEAEIMYVTDKVYWVEVDGIKAMMPKAVVSSHLGNFKKGEIVPVEVINLDLKRLHITLKPIRRNKQKIPTTKKTVRITPTNLAEELGINPKSLRAWLRNNYTRPLEAKNSRWYLTDKQVKAAKQHFTKTKPAVKKPAVKKPAVKKPAVKKPISSIPLWDYFYKSKLDSEHKASTRLFAHYVKKALDEFGKEETALTFPANKNKIRLINCGIESAWIDGSGLLTVVINDHNTSVDLKHLIDTYVKFELRNNAYKKLPVAVPLFIPHEGIKKHTKTLKKAFEVFLSQASTTGKNPWKKYNDDRIFELLNSVLLKKIKY